jgi:hypothetical protein
MGRSSIGWRGSATSSTVSDDIPDPGIIVIGKIDSAVEAFNVPSSVRVRVELASDQADNVRPRSDALPPVPTLEDVRNPAR